MDEHDSEEIVRNDWIVDGASLTGRLLPRRCCPSVKSGMGWELVLRQLGAARVSGGTWAVTLGSSRVRLQLSHGTLTITAVNQQPVVDLRPLVGVVDAAQLRARILQFLQRAGDDGGTVDSAPAPAGTVDTNEWYLDAPTRPVRRTGDSLVVVEPARLNDLMNQTGRSQSRVLTAEAASLDELLETTRQTPAPAPALPTSAPDGAEDESVLVSEVDVSEEPSARVVSSSSLHDAIAADDELFAWLKSSPTHQIRPLATVKAETHPDPEDDPLSSVFMSATSAQHEALDTEMPTSNGSPGVRRGVRAALEAEAVALRTRGELLRRELTEVDARLEAVLRALAEASVLSSDASGARPSVSAEVSAEVSAAVSIALVVRDEPARARLQAAVGRHLPGLSVAASVNDLLLREDLAHTAAVVLLVPKPDDSLVPALRHLRLAAPATRVLVLGENDGKSPFDRDLVDLRLPLSERLSDVVATLLRGLRSFGIAAEDGTP